MEYLDLKSAWEDAFAKELETLNQKMSTFDIESLSKSRLRLSLENRILDWKKYEGWVHENFGCASVKEGISEATLRSYSIGAQQAHDLYSTHSFWNQDLVPVALWEKQLIVFGLQYSSHLQKIPNHIFILAPPRVLNFFANLLDLNKAAGDPLDQFNEFFGDTSQEQMDGLGSNTQISVDFKDLNSADTIAQLTPRPRKALRQTETEIWDLIRDRREEYFFESRKQFDAFLVMRINFDNTQIFMLDPDLQKLNINEKLFEYSLNTNNAFKQVFESGESVSLESTKLGLDLLKYKFISIAALKRSNTVVGFLVGFKNAMPTGQDITLLEDLSSETAQAS